MAATRSPEKGDGLPKGCITQDFVAGNLINVAFYQRKFEKSTFFRRNENLGFLLREMKMKLIVGATGPSETIFFIEHIKAPDETKKFLGRRKNLTWRGHGPLSSTWCHSWSIHLFVVKIKVTTNQFSV